MIVRFPGILRTAIDVDILATMSGKHQSLNKVWPQLLHDAWHHKWRSRVEPSARCCDQLELLSSSQSGWDTQNWASLLIEPLRLIHYSFLQWETECSTNQAKKRPRFGWDPPDPQPVTNVLNILREGHDSLLKEFPLLPCRGIEGWFRERPAFMLFTSGT